MGSSWVTEWSKPPVHFILSSLIIFRSNIPLRLFRNVEVPRRVIAKLVLITLGTSSK
jgi:hypothetical protein